MPVQIDLISRRRFALWQVKESDFFIVHIDNDLEPSETRDQLIAKLDSLHREICDVLAFPDVGNPESLLKLNVWLYADTVLEQAGLITEATPKQFYGAASPAGVHIALHGLDWDSALVIDCIIHEDIHAVLGKNVGEAPSLLNEGIAAYCERMLSRDGSGRLNELREGWMSIHVSEKSGWLRRACQTEEFWQAYNANLPMYEVGGYLVRYIIETQGLDVLKQIFLSSHYMDDSLADKLEQLFGVKLEHIEQQLAA
jgi:hypothetical protein